MQNKLNLIIIALFLILACGEQEIKEDQSRYSDDRVVARVDDQILTLGEVNRKFKDDHFDNIQDEYETKKEYVEKAIERFLHIKAAREAGLSYDVDSTTFLGYLFQELYKHDADVEEEASDSYVDDYFEKYGGEVQFGPLIVRDSTLIDSIYNLLENGSDWDSLVLEYTILDPGKKRGGSLGYVPFGQYDPELESKAYELEIGKYSKPFRIRNAWCIIKLFDRIKNSRDYLEKYRDAYKQAASKYYQLQQTDRYVEELLRDYNYRINWDTIDLMIGVADSVEKSGSLPADMPGSAYLVRTAFTPAMLEKKMMEYRGGGFTIGDYLDIMDNYNPYKSPEIRDKYDMKNILTDEATRRIKTIRALELRCDTLQTFKDAMKNYEENWLISELNKQILAGIDTVTEKEIRQYYDDHPDEYFRPEQVRVSAISVKTKDEALELLDKLKMGASFTALAIKYSTDKKTGVDGGDLNFFTEKKYTEIYDAARGLNVGDIGGPVEMYGNYWIFEVTYRLSREHRPYKLAWSNIRSQLMSDRRYDVVRSWVDENKKNSEFYRNLQPLRDDLGIAADDTTRVEMKEEDIK